MKDLSDFDPSELTDSNAMAISGAYSIALTYDLEMLNSGQGGLMEVEDSEDWILSQVYTVITSDYKYETAIETFNDIESYLSQQYGETRYTSRRGQSLPMVKAYNYNTYLIVTNEIHGFSESESYLTVPEYTQRIVDIGDNLFMVIDHHLSVQNSSNGYEFSHNLVYSLIPVDISDRRNIIHQEPTMEPTAMPTAEATPELTVEPSGVNESNGSSVFAYVSADMVNMRELPTTQSERLTRLLKYAYLEVLSTADYDGTVWIEILYNGIHGYVQSDYIHVMTEEENRLFYQSEKYEEGIINNASN